MNPKTHNHKGIQYEIIGTGPSLIMLHGIADTKEDWYDYGYVDGLKDSHQLILIDFRGRGESIKYYDPNSYSLDAFSDDIQGVAEHLGLQSFDLLGYSMGGVIAHWFSKKFPTNLRSLVSVDGPIITDLIGIYQSWSENIETVLRDYAADDRNSDTKRTRINKADLKALQALSLGLSRSILENITEFLSMPDPDYPYLVLTSNWEVQGLNVDDYLQWARSSTQHREFQDFDHADFGHRGIDVLPELLAFYKNLA